MPGSYKKIWARHGTTHQLGRSYRVGPWAVVGRGLTGRVVPCVGHLQLKGIPEFNSFNFNEKFSIFISLNIKMLRQIFGIVTVDAKYSHDVGIKLILLQRRGYNLIEVQLQNLSFQLSNSFFFVFFRQRLVILSTIDKEIKYVPTLIIN